MTILTMELEESLIPACNFYILKYGVINWFAIARRFPQKHREQLQKIFLKHVSKKRKDSKRYHIWSDCDTQILIEAVANHGRDWYYIYDHLFPWLTNVKLKNHYYVVGQSGRLYFFDQLCADEDYFNSEHNVRSEHKIECSASIIELISYLLY